MHRLRMSLPLQLPPGESGGSRGQEGPRPPILDRRSTFGVAGVLTTPEEFDQVQEHRRVVAAIREGLDDVEAGRVLDDEDLDAELDAEFGSL